MGKAYANRKKVKNNDFYETPICLVKELLNIYNIPKEAMILEPCCGTKAISNFLKECGYICIEEKDIIYGNDFLKDLYKENQFDYIITNPPFYLWDDIVIKAKYVAKKTIVIGRTNYFGSHSRLINKVWENLEYLFVFDRQVMYEQHYADNYVKCGCLVTGWFVFNKDYTGEPKIKIINIDKYIQRKKDRIKNKKLL